MKTLDRKKQRAYPAGLVVSGGGMNSTFDGPAEIMFAGMIGALAGFVCGLLAGTLTRVLTINAASGTRGGIHWAAYGALAGGMVLVLVALFD